MKEREKDIQEVCRQVIEKAVRWEGNPNGCDEYSCVFCDRSAPDRGYTSAAKIKHLPDCAVLIATDLRAGVVNE